MFYLRFQSVNIETNLLILNFCVFRKLLFNGEGWVFTFQEYPHPTPRKKQHNNITKSTFQRRMGATRGSSLTEQHLT